MSVPTLIGRLLCRLGFHDVVWTTGQTWIGRGFGWETCRRNGCHWLVMRKSGPR